MKKSRKSTAVLVPSQIEIIDTLPEDIQLRVYKALFDYELYGTDFDRELLDNPVIQALWIMSRPLIDKRIQWAENGRNGGIAKGKNSKSIAKRKQTDSKLIANQKQNDSKSIADKDKDMDMEKEYPYPTDTLLDGASLDKGDNKEEDENYVDIDWDSIPEP